MAVKKQLVGDIGGTNARFALVDGERGQHHPKTYAAAEYDSMAHAIRQYLSDTKASQPASSVLAVATRVNEDYISFTNNDKWSFSKNQLARDIGIESLTVVNDFTALAVSVPHLDSSQIRQIGPSTPQPNGALGIIGPGTGLGVSGLVKSELTEEWIPLHSEGGHCTAALSSDREFQVLKQFQLKFGQHVSFERFLSGPGLVNIVSALREIDGLPAADYLPSHVTSKGLDNSDPHCVEALELFCGLLGACAGDLALTIGAWGGIYIGGGIVPKLGEFLDQSQFRARFEAKGRVRDEMLTIPTFVICDPYPALTGASVLLPNT